MTATMRAAVLAEPGRFGTDAFVNAVCGLDEIQQAFDSLAERPGDLKTQIRIRKL